MGTGEEIYVPPDGIKTLVSTDNSISLSTVSGGTEIDLQVTPQLTLTDITIYANAATGSDLNDGLTSATAVQTIQKAIDLLQDYPAIVGIVQLEGNTSFNIGSSLKFFPSSNSIGRFIIRGTKRDIINDTVASIPASTIGPFNTWTTINGTTGGYTISDYVTYFIENTTKNRIYSVLDNGTSSVNAITGGEAPNDLGPPFDVGDSFNLFKTQSTLTFNGEFVIDNPSNTMVTFEYVTLFPGIPETSWINPTMCVTKFRGCFMRMNSLIGAYRGSFVLEGCFSDNTTSGSPYVFCTGDPDICRKIDSFWLDGGRMVFTDICSVNYLNCTNAPLTPTVSATVTIQSSDFQGYSMKINSQSNYQIFITDGSNFGMENIESENTAAVGFPARPLNIEGSYGQVTNSRLTNNSNITNNECFFTSFGCSVFLLGDHILESTGRCLGASGSNRIVVLGSLSATSTNGATPVVRLDLNSSFDYRLNSASSFARFENSASDSNIPLIQLDNGSSFNISNRSGPTTFTQVEFIARNSAIFDISESSKVSLLNFSNSAGFSLVNTFAGQKGISLSGESTYSDSNLSASVPTVYSIQGGTSVYLDLGSRATFETPITDLVATNLIECGTLPSIGGPGPYSTSINDYSLTPTQNSSVTFRLSSPLITPPVLNFNYQPNLFFVNQPLNLTFPPSPPGDIGLKVFEHTCTKTGKLSLVASSCFQKISGNEGTIFIQLRLNDQLFSPSVQSGYEGEQSAFAPDLSGLTINWCGDVVASDLLTVYAVATAGTFSLSQIGVFSGAAGGQLSVIEY